MSLLESIPLELRRLKVLPVVRQHLQPFSLDIVMQRCVANHFGVLMSGMKKEFEREDLMSLHSCYKHFASKSDTELRRCCASQLVPTAKAACSLDPHAFTEHYSDTFQHLSMDSDEQVRLSIATHLHEIARFISKDCCCGVLTRPLVALLRDDSSAVQSAVLPMLNTTLHHLTTSADRRDHLVHEVLSALVDMEANCGRNWRIQVHLASSFPRFHEVFSSEQIHDHFLPMAFRFLSHSAAAVRPVAAEGIASFFRHCKGEHQRSEIFLRLVREFARGRSFTQRAAFGDVCFNVVKRFSSRFIKDWFFDLILDLLYDSVPNIRLQITRILPSLKQIIRLPEDVDLLERLNNAMSNAMTDNDRDVSLLARQVNDSYKRTPVRMGASMTNTLGSGAAAFETEDRRREEEELDFNLSPEEAKEMKMEMIGAHKRMQPRASAPDGIRFPATNKKLGIEMTRSGGLGLKGGAGAGLGTAMAGRNSSKADEGGGGSVRSVSHGSGSREGRNSYTGSGGLFMKDSGDRNSGGGRTVGPGMQGGSSGDRNSGSGRTVVGYGSGSSSNSSSSSSISSTASRAGVGASTGRAGAGAASSGRGASTAAQLPTVSRSGMAPSSSSKSSTSAGQGSVMASRTRGSPSSSSTPSSKPTSLPASSRNRGRS
ncbi:armadillo-type protein [Dunaliella salina]|uniref:Armadillo-type protein n=1 Tax=Dunaliella salina TaxID=3046 RepID=A0ABQ7G4V2_DUNSA|nr:armadillo-type protein [Dunaliella salina]|eukprot:KAF5829638.1 armadillo-type protein [Dunaliella salina]